MKPTTLNARFRRQQIAVRTIGRTNFVPLELALDLAELHKYSLIGWPTLQQASQLTGVKTGTIKARFEKGQLEGHIDLTKRLRINPAALGNLSLYGASGHTRDAGGQAHAQPVRDNRRNKKSNGLPNPARVRMGATFHQTGRASLKATNECAKEIPPKPLPFVLPSAPEPEINVLTGKDYGLLEIADRLEAREDNPEARQRKPQKSGCLGCLSYDPERPFSVSECTVGKYIRYGPYGGTIVKIIGDPFSPRILVKFPKHEHPLMREVLLVVEKRRA